MTAGPARFPYVEMDSIRGTSSRLACMPLSLGIIREVEVSGLLDTGASINVLPLGVGLRLGADWEQPASALKLTGSLRDVEAKVLFASAKVASFSPVRLAFAWAKTDDIPVLLGQINFFMEFDVCFFRSRSVFEVKPGTQIRSDRPLP